MSEPNATPTPESTSDRARSPDTPLASIVGKRRHGRIERVTDLRTSPTAPTRGRHAGPGTAIGRGDRRRALEGDHGGPPASRAPPRSRSSGSGTPTSRPSSRPRSAASTPRPSTPPSQRRPRTERVPDPAERAGPGGPPGHADRQGHRRPRQERSSSTSAARARASSRSSSSRARDPRAGLDHRGRRRPLRPRRGHPDPPPQGGRDRGELGEPQARASIVEARVTKVIKGGLEVDVDGIRGFMPISQIDLSPRRGRRDLRQPEVQGHRHRGQPAREEPRRLPPRAARAGAGRAAREDLGDARGGPGPRGRRPLGQGLRRLRRPRRRRRPAADRRDELVARRQGRRPGQDRRQGRGQGPQDRPDGAEAHASASSSSRPARGSTSSEKYPRGTMVKGKVTRLMEFGAFVELEPGIEGLIHISELSPTRVRRVADIVKPDQEVEVRILKVEPEAKKIALSLLPDPRKAGAVARREKTTRRTRPRRPPSPSARSRSRAAWAIGIVVRSGRYRVGPRVKVFVGCSPNTDPRPSVEPRRHRLRHGSPTPPPAQPQVSPTGPTRSGPTRPGDLLSCRGRDRETLAQADGRDRETLAQADGRDSDFRRGPGPTIGRLFSA